MEKTEKILTLKNGIEAQVMDSILNEKEIPHIIHSYHDSAYDGIYQTQSAWGYIEALPEYAKKILDIYREMEDNLKTE
ncbi:MAG: hypothetical protein HQ541_05680 [Mariniphaga sp.]|nr:hypothetical protein [Mariniphaga sp.]